VRSAQCAVQTAIKSLKTKATAYINKTNWTISYLNINIFKSLRVVSEEPKGLAPPSPFSKFLICRFPADRPIFKILTITALVAFGVAFGK